MHWLACLPSPIDDGQALAKLRLQALSWWALQFTPRVARLEDAVLFEVQSCLRLFGGAAALHQRVLQQADAAGMDLHATAWAPSSLGALALARCGIEDGMSTPLEPLLDALPLHALSAAQEHRAMLARLGCRSLGDLRRLPRAGLGRRFGKGLVQALDQAYGQAPEVHQWLQAPDVFEARLELPFRVEQSIALLHYARHLLAQLCAWLAARHAGIQQLELHWLHDSMRSREAGSGAHLTLHTANKTRDFGHLSRLLAEHLAQLTLAAPVGEISLKAGQILPLEELPLSLLPQSPDQANEALPQLLERLALRLGSDKVRVGRLQEDHRPECMQVWQAWPGTAAAPPARHSDYPQPSWLLDPPLRLEVRQDQPQYRGKLQLLAGPQRIEGGWWDLAESSAQHLQRDYFVALSAQAGFLWIYQQRLDRDKPGWFLHGIFA